MGMFDKLKPKTALAPKKASKPTKDEIIDALQRENRTVKLQLARVTAERVMLQELSRQLQNINQNHMLMLGDVINNAAGMLTDESVAASVKALASTVKQVVPTAVEDIVQRLAYADPRTQGIVAALPDETVRQARVIDGSDYFADRDLTKFER